MKAHRELVLADRDNLLALVRHVRGSLDVRTHRVSRAQVREYARARLLVEDEEWERAKAEADPQNWLAKIAI
jgi:uncharacterized ubiquitin-like protein YukD